MTTTQEQNLTLVNLIKSQDAFTFAALQSNTQPDQIVDTPYVPMDDVSEAERWEQYAAATGLGQVINDDDYQSDAAELFTTDADGTP